MDPQPRTESACPYRLELERFDLGTQRMSTLRLVALVVGPFLRDQTTRTC